MEFKNIKNIIFDLGAVIINIDVSLTLKSFAKHYGVSISELQDFLQSSSIWNHHELGLVNDQTLVDELNRRFSSSGIQITTTEFIDAWNSLLLDIPQERIELLKKLSGKYRLFLLSNTNQTHIDKINEKLAAENDVHNRLESLFEKTYYSHLIGLRKPDPKIYHYVLNDNAINPSETLFLDDSEQNILSARTVGIQTILVTSEHSIVELLANA